MKLKHVNSFALLLIFGLAVLAACNLSEPVNKQFDKSNKPLQIAVYTYKNTGDLTRALQERMGKDGMRQIEYPKAKREGWSIWETENSCEIHVVQINSMDQKGRFETWGHELAHCVYGKYHRENNL